MYATYEDLETRLGRTFTEDEIKICNSFLEGATTRIDETNSKASESAKKEVAISMVARVVSNLGVDVPVGATQGSMSAVGYAQSWTMSGGSTGELYFSKEEKRLLGVGNRIGAYSPVEDL